MRYRACLLLTLIAATLPKPVAAADLREGLTQRFGLHTDDRGNTAEVLLLTQWKDDCVLQLLLLESDQAGRIALSRVYKPRNGVTLRTLDDAANSWKAILTERSGLLFKNIEETARPDIVGTLVAKGPAAVTRTLSVPGESPLTLISTTFESEDATVARIVHEGSASGLPERILASSPRSLALQLSLLGSILKSTSGEGVPAILEFSPLITSLQGILAAPSPSDRAWQRFAGLAWQFEGRGVHRGAKLAGDDLAFASNFGLASPKEPLKYMESSCSQHP